MSSPKQCPKCQSENIYFDGNIWNCPECANEWAEPPAGANSSEALAEGTENDGLVRDAHGQILSSGDAVIVIKELRIKGSSSSVKVGTKVKNIRIGDAGDGHDISCKIDGLGAINLKSEYVKKA